MHTNKRNILRISLLHRIKFCIFIMLIHNYYNCFMNFFFHNEYQKPSKSGQNFSDREFRYLEVPLYNVYQNRD